MKLQIDEGAAQTNGLASQEFKIAANATAFSVLIDKLYTNKVASMVREIMSNAYDSHIQARKPAVPFSVHVPTPTEPWFSVRDFGVSMDHDTIMTLYSTLFSSTKRDSDDVVGAFGIGSKSPFAYCDSFEVTAWMDGEKRVYTIFRDRGMPCIALVSKDASDEPTGIEVNVPVSTSLYEFMPAINEIAQNLATAPLGVTVTPRVPVYTFTLASGVVARFFTPVSEYKISAYVLQGCVRYPYEATSPIPKLDCELVVPIGSVAVTASREALSLDTATRMWLSAQLTLVKDEVAKLKLRKQAEISALTPWAARYSAAEQLAAQWDDAKLAIKPLPIGNRMGRAWVKDGGSYNVKAFGKEVSTLRPMNTLIIGKPMVSRSDACKDMFRNGAVFFEGDEYAVRRVISRMQPTEVLNVHSLAKNVRLTAKNSGGDYKHYRAWNGYARSLKYGDFPFDAVWAEKGTEVDYGPQFVSVTGEIVVPPKHYTKKMDPNMHVQAVYDRKVDALRKTWKQQAIINDSRAGMPHEIVTRIPHKFFPRVPWTEDEKQEIAVEATKLQAFYREAFPRLFEEFDERTYVMQQIKALAAFGAAPIALVADDTEDEEDEINDDDE